MVKNKEEYIVSLIRPANITAAEMARFICDAVKKLDTCGKDFTKEVMAISEVTVRRSEKIVNPRYVTVVSATGEVTVDEQ